MERPIAVDLFAGAGGLSLGFEQAGFDIVASVDIDPIHCAVHKYNFPNCKTICGDISNMSGSVLRNAAGLINREIDVIIGGAPCQGFSMIGKRAFDDSRNQLVAHYVRIISEIKPRFFVFENVKGLTIGKHRAFLEEFMNSLSEQGYNIEFDYKVLNAVDFGVPQDRKRLFILGARKGECLPMYPHPTFNTTVGDAIMDIPDAELYEELWDRDWVVAKFAEPSTYAAALRDHSRDSNNFGHPRRYNKHILTSSLLTNHSQLSRDRFSNTPPNEIEPVSRFKKLALSGVCNTLRAGTASDRGAFTSPRPIHPIYPRVITVREAARLHSYPDWFRFHATKWHGFRQIGNSVPPMLARAVGLQVISAMGIKPSPPTQTVKLGDDSLLNISMTEAASIFGVSSKIIPPRNRSTND